MTIRQISHIFSVRKFIEPNAVHLNKIDHPPYSSDQTLCDYWLFDCIQQRLGSKNGANSLLRSSTKIANAIPYKKWIKTFNKYIERLQKLQKQRVITLNIYSKSFLQMISKVKLTSLYPHSFQNKKIDRNYDIKFLNSILFKF